MLIDEEEQLEPGICEATEVMPPLNATRVQSMFDKSNPDGSCSNSDRDTAELDVKVDTNDQRKKKIKRDENFDDNEWSKTTDFNPQWIAKINQHQHNVRLRNRF